MRILSAIKVITTAACLSTCLFSQAFSFDTKARAAYVIDHTSGTILLSKNSDLPLPPASMSKLMTLYMTFEFTLLQPFTLVLFGPRAASH